jgi:hypothetical protein
MIYFSAVTVQLRSHVNAFKKYIVNINGTENLLHGVNKEGVHLALSPKLGTELKRTYREGVHL